MAKKKAARKRPAPKRIRIPAGSIGVTYESIGCAVEQLLNHEGFTLADLEKTTIETSYERCYYESDSASIEVTWQDIYYEN